jgi:prepilin signal peptidase PulO-like enzyme (type II secretory pathway)
MTAGFCYHAPVMIAIPLLFFLLGAITASFIGVVVVRLHTGESFLSGRSRCDICGATLPPSALVPIVSYVLQGRRARCCGARLSLYSPLTELLLGGLFVLAYLKLNLVLALPFVLLSFAILLALVLYDLMHQILPPSLLWVFGFSTAVGGFLTASNIGSFERTVLVALVLGAVLGLIYFFSHGKAMGFADAPLVFALALLTGSAALPGFVFTFWVGAVIGIVMLARRPRGSRMGIEVPFAPFLAIGFLLAYFTQWNPLTIVAVLH